VPDPIGTAATQRIITVLQVLADHPKRGINVYDLLKGVAVYVGTEDSQRDQLSRDFRQLRKEGHVIENIAGEGEEARYRLVPGDDRVRVAFSPEQLFQLQRGAVLVGVEGLGAEEAPASTPTRQRSHPDIDIPPVPGALGDVQRAVTTRAQVRFDYSGKTRTVHPYGLRIAPRGWVLEGWEQESEQSKTFSLQRMSAVRIGRPGTAAAPERAERPTLDPLRYRIDPPAPAQLRVPVRFREQVDAVLHHPLRDEPGPEVEGEATQVLHYTVTNHTNFLVRVLRLDTRVVLLGGDGLRTALQTMLLRLSEVQ
jgi:predicted DNA-binding transcriptional regulator YafY